MESMENKLDAVARKFLNKQLTEIENELYRGLSRWKPVTEHQDWLKKELNKRKKEILVGFWDKFLSVSGTWSYLSSVSLYLDDILPKADFSELQKQFEKKYQEAQKKQDNLYDKKFSTIKNSILDARNTLLVDHKRIDIPTLKNEIIKKLGLIKE